ncbi:putative chromate transport protein [Zhongshania aliphaticivorans]|uniref:Putative chromate transport protein n=1 Tax=Zhongshania aliphaticivorans TaxID=1470434 RepID=A0A5S9NW29_9GAMM|nr:chromate efflux transporter [Zhongshania aliphaticivorans]CAA0088712.1 putative chromate transport protein [Zhongshania aliphaticivorans]CAA0094971.1 putative chromate transport protein [Zhongshania aliphaticivorans]
MEGATSKTKNASVLEILQIFLRLGLTSFGGPIAHIGYFREEFVTRRKWLSEQGYADIVALCQFLPGPASSQVGMAIGLMRGGYAGAAAAWLGFTLPSAMALILFALGIANYGEVLDPAALHGLKVVAVAVVAQAVWGMALTLCPDRQRITIMMMACCLVLFYPTAWGQLGVILSAGLIGLYLFKPNGLKVESRLSNSVSSRSRRREGAFFLALFSALLIGLPLILLAWPSQALQLVDAFYRAGSLVFGGGHVVLPLLQAEVVSTAWVQEDTFLAGYGAAQAVPGPLFTFAAFLGASIDGGQSSLLNATLCLLAIFLPSFLLIAGVLPYWEQLRHYRRTQSALWGVNAAVVGLLLAALYQPVWTSAIHGPQDFGLALTAFVALVFWKLPPWLVVLSCGLAAWLLNLVL